MLNNVGRVECICSALFTIHYNEETIGDFEKMHDMTVWPFNWGGLVIEA